MSEEQLNQLMQSAEDKLKKYPGTQTRIQCDVMVRLGEVWATPGSETVERLLEMKTLMVPPDLIMESTKDKVINAYWVDDVKIVGKLVQDETSEHCEDLFSLTCQFGNCRLNDQYNGINISVDHIHPELNQLVSVIQASNYNVNLS